MIEHELLIQASKLLEYATYHDGRYDQATNERWQAACVDFQKRASAVTGRRRYSDMWRPETVDVPKGDVDLLASLIDQVGHRESSECWCGPTLDYVDPDTGNEVWVHHKAS